MTYHPYRTDPYVRSAVSEVLGHTPEGGIVIAQSVFYPTGGGQPGDSGHLLLADGTKLRIVDARKGSDHDDVIHVLEEGSEPPAPGILYQPPGQLRPRPAAGPPETATADHFTGVALG